MTETTEQADRTAAEQEFADKLLDSLTNDQENWSLQIVFDQERMVHATNGMKFHYPLAWMAVVIVDGPSIKLPLANYNAIIARVGEIKAKNETAKLEGN